MWKPELVIKLCYFMEQNWSKRHLLISSVLWRATKHYATFRATVCKSKTLIHTTKNFIGLRQRLLRKIPCKVVKCIVACNDSCITCQNTGLWNFYEKYWFTKKTSKVFCKLWIQTYVCWNLCMLKILKLSSAYVFILCI